MKDGMRLDELLVERGFFSDLKKAQGYIMEGKVLVYEVREDKPGLIVKKHADIRVKGMDCIYVSRGGLKLEAAINNFGVHCENRCALDAGACTGGFTDCLIKHGIGRVYAIEVGFGQLAGSIAQDDRVVNMEKTNIGDVTEDMLNPAPSLGVIDLSYLSLTKAVGIFKNLLKPDDMGNHPEIIALVKPLFEVKVKVASELNEALYLEAIQLAVESGRENGITAVGVMSSPILGSKGTLEFLVHYKESGLEVSEDEIVKVVQEGMRLLES